LRAPKDETRALALFRDAQSLKPLNPKFRIPPELAGAMTPQGFTGGGGGGGGADTNTGGDDGEGGGGEGADTVVLTPIGRGTKSSTTPNGCGAKRMLSQNNFSPNSDEGWVGPEKGRAASGRSLFGTAADG
jgi:hypothetical protein